MGEAIERAARAYHDLGKQVYVIDGVEHLATDGWVPWEELDDEDRRICGNVVRAVLQAIREPTDAMIKAVEDNCVAWECFREDGSKWAERDVWRAMIDSALAETPSEP